ncbi:MAG: aspartate-semialdehyde dehydrogenase, partial [Ignavibacteria bacterium]|nr:aspartate-semialdehyde dehydrogenase [Ignavibacteria bacterium]
KIHLFASGRSEGTEIRFRGRDCKVQNIENADFSNIDIALFSAGKEVSTKYAPLAVKNGCIVIDNGSYWRMNGNVPLVVPEVNPEAVKNHHGLIANPNCSTIQLVVALKPVENNFGLNRVVVSTYQSISGAGQKGIDKLKRELYEGPYSGKVGDHPIAFNTIFHEISDPSGFSVEEIKMKDEIRKIIDMPDLRIAVTCVRLPVLGGHGESVNIETKKKISLTALRKVLKSAQSIVILDIPKKEIYPTTLHANNKDVVFIGRLRIDDSVENGAYLWIVADNVRKGAATNAVQIAELIAKDNLLAFEQIDFE